MRKLALCAGAALVVLGSVESADAQVRQRYGYYGTRWGSPYIYRGSRWNGGAVAAGLVGGLVLGGLAAAAATPAYSYPYGYGYGYGYPYGYGYQPSYGGYYPAPVARPYYGYSPAPYYGGGVVYSADPYAAYHEIRGGYRTFYRPGYGRVIVGSPY
ncbi:MAG: hypothetical protein K0S56_3346 [Microvirga sp.]|jgi:hypothetical protein|nr:hypothetical protein [Microvirga sp.]